MASSSPAGGDVSPVAPAASEEPVITGSPVKDTAAAPSPVAAAPPVVPTSDDEAGASEGALYPEVTAKTEAAGSAVSAAAAAGVAAPAARPAPSAPAGGKGAEEEDGAAAASRGAGAASAKDGDELGVPELLLWRQPFVSGAVLGSVLACAYFGTFLLVEWALLLLLVSGGCIKAYNALAKPAKPVKALSVPVTRANVNAVTGLVGDAVVLAVEAVNDVLNWRSIESSVRALAWVWLIFTFGGLSYLLLNSTVQIIAFLGAFTVPFAVITYGAVLKSQVVPVAQAQLTKVSEIVELLSSKYTQVTAAVPPTVLYAAFGVLAVVFIYMAPSFMLTSAALVVAGADVVRRVSAHAKTD